MFTPIPELTLSADEITQLYSLYTSLKESYGNLHITRSGRVQQLTVVRDYPETSLTTYLLDKINPEYVHAGYFISNNGIDPHTDGYRKCTISFEISNPDNIPITFQTDDGIILDRAYYNGIPLMWNHRVRHSAEYTKSERVFYQIELAQPHNYDHYVELYQSGILLQ